MLRVVSPYISEIFPCATEIQSPYCRAGCGLMGNWFTEIPQTLPAGHRIDCRRCLGMEIDSARLECPECGTIIKIESGVLMSGNDTGNDETATRKNSMHLKTGNLVAKILNLQPSEIALILTAIPHETDSALSGNGVERVFIDTVRGRLFSHRAKACAMGEGFAHYLAGPFNCDFLRPAQYDAIVSTVPTDSCDGGDKICDQIPLWLRPSGRILLMYPKSNTDRRELNEKLGSLPDTFADFKYSLESGKDYWLVLFTREIKPRTTPILPERRAD
ncbi:MAG TPA: hypothetical protein ENN67_07885 [Firmicutes bacterium]|nr:hypothetical protein [Bacillota bacterium]